MFHAPLRAFRASLASVLEGGPRWEDVETVVDLHLRMAEARLDALARTGRARPDQFGLSLEDLALDCIAELFARDDDGRFVQLAYYEGAAGADDATLLSMVRRLVWSTVDQALFRRHQEYSPARSKQLRVLKRALRAHPDVRVERVGRRLVARVVGGAEGAGRGTMPPERLVARVAARLAGRGGGGTPDLVEAVVEVLRDQTTYAAEYPVTGLATAALEVAVALSHRSHVGDGARGRPPVLHPGGLPARPALDGVDVRAHVAQAVEATRARLGPRYLERSGLDAEVFEAYLAAAGHAVASTFAPSHTSDEPEVTLLEALRERLPGLMGHAYRAHHRTRLEYVSRCVREALLASVREEVVD